MQTQKERIQELQQQVQCAKRTYATSLKSLEQISEEIHKMRGDLSKAAPSGPREPGVGAELTVIPLEIAQPTQPPPPTRHSASSSHSPNVLPSTTLDYALELDRCEMVSIGGATSRTTSTAVSERGDDDVDEDVGDIDNSVNVLVDNQDIDFDLEALRRKVKVLAVRPVEGGDGEQTQDVWETELNDTVNKLDRLLLKREMNVGSGIASSTSTQIGVSLPVTPLKFAGSAVVAGPIKMLQKAEPLPTVNVSMRELPLLTRISNEIAERTQKFSKRRLSLE